MYKVKNPWLLILTNDCWISIRKNFFCDSILFNIIQIFFSDLYRPHRHHDIEVKHLKLKNESSNQADSDPTLDLHTHKGQCRGLIQRWNPSSPTLQASLNKIWKRSVAGNFKFVSELFAITISFFVYQFFLTKRAYFKSNGV